MSKYNQYFLFLFYLLGFLYFFILQLHSAWPYTVDDAFITLRYAKNLSAHQQIIWNIGEPHLEGYSNFLYMIFAAALITFKINPILWLKIISILALILTLIGVYSITRIWLPPYYALLTPLILLIHPGEIIWAVSGLETSFFQMLVVFATLFIIKNLNNKNISSFFHSGLLLSFASLTRPEGPMLFVAYSLLLLSMSYIKKKMKLSYFVFGFMLLYIPYFLWHYQYFGRLFPNPVYCKALNAPSAPLELDYSYLIIVLPMLLFSYFLVRKSFDKRFWFLIIPSICYLLALYNADWIVAFLNRHFLCAYALILPFIVCGLVDFTKHLNLSLGKNTQLMITLLFAVSVGYLFSSYQYTLYHINYLTQSGKEGNQLRMRVTSWLNHEVKQGQTISIGDCGVIPYYFNGEVVDTYCINSLKMTTPPISYSYERFNQWLLNEKKPDYIIQLALITRQKLFYPPSDLLLLNDPLFHQTYQKVKKFTLGKGARASYQYVVYKKLNNQPAAPQAY